MTGLGADDVDPGGALGGEAGLRVWLPQGVAIGTVGQWMHYDTAPAADPDRQSSFTVLVRATAALGK